MSDRDIAQQLGISKRTVDAHPEHIVGKLGFSSRVQPATWLEPPREP
jgi:DNA-binding CsgD family transcriptional regulator